MKLEGIEFPLNPLEIDRLEEQNAFLGFSINVFTESEGDVLLFRKGQQASGKSEINVLLLEGINLKGEKVFHYILINNLARFLSKRYVKDGRVTGASSTNFACKKCFHVFFSLDKRDAHESLCGIPDGMKLGFLPPHEKIFFKKPWARFPHILAGFVDFESILIKTKGETIF